MMARAGYGRKSVACPLFCSNGRPMKLAIDGITSFSYKPLKLGIGIGITLSICSFCFLLFVFIARLFDLVVMEPGYASLMCVLLFFFGIMLIMLGVIGEYIGRIFEEVKGRPLYIICDQEGDLSPSGRHPATDA